MATRRKGRVGKTVGPDARGRGLDLDDVGELDGELEASDIDDEDDGNDPDDALWRPAARRPAGGRGARSLPHDWADFDFGGEPDDWR